MNAQLLPFLLGAFLLLYALLGNFSKQSRLIPARPVVIRSGAAILGILLVLLGIYSGAEQSAPTSTVAAVAQQPAQTMAAQPTQSAPAEPETTQRATKATPAPTSEQQTTDAGSQHAEQQQPANVEIHDMPVVTATPRKVTVREIPDSVAREILKHLPVPAQEPKN